MDAEPEALGARDLNLALLAHGTEYTHPVDATTGAVVDLPALAIGSFNPATLGIIYTRVGEYLLSAQLSALQDQGKLHILSSPSITTQDNRLAFI